MQLGLYTYPAGNRIQNTANGQYNSGISFTYGQWNHFLGTFDGSSLKTYINGVLVNTKAITNGILSRSKLTIGARCRGSSYDTFFQGKINDVRIYDHCLSAAEVREVAQGLVLHYKLDGFNNASILPTQYQQLEYIESAGTSYFDTGYKFDITNDEFKVIFKGNDTSNNGMIFASSSAPYIWLYYYSSNGIRIYADNSSNGQQGITGITSDLNQHTAEFKNKTYYIDGSNKGTLSNTYGNTKNNIWLFSYGGNGYPFKGRIYYVEIKNNGTYKRIFIPAKRLSDAAIGMYDLITQTFYTSSNTAFTAGAAVGTLTIQDSSGYNHNGTINGTLTASNDAVRYFSSIYMPQATTITHSRPVFGGIDQEWTCSMWVKLDTVNQSNIQMNNFNLGNRIVHSANGQALMYLNSGTNDYYNYSNLAVAANTWTHIAFVFKNSNVTKLIYINGVNHTNTNGPNKTSTPAGIPDTVIVGTNLKGYISDYRIYCTALDADAVRQLYEVGAKIDNKGSIHTYEFTEHLGIEENAKFVNNSATSIAYDAATDTYTIVSPVGTSSWGYGVRLADTPALMVPYGMTYRWTAEVWTPVALTVNTDYNNTATTTWAGNDNDATSTRLSSGTAIPANTWTRIYRGASNTHSSNTNHLPIRDYSSLGLVTNGQSGPVTWKIRHLQWYLVDTAFKPEIKKTGVFEAEHFTEVEQNLNKPAQFNKQMFSVNGNEFIEL